MTHRAKVLSVLALGLAALVGWPVAAHYHAKWKVANYQRQLRAAGEKLAIEELIPQLPPADLPNSAPELQRLGARLASASLSNLPPTLKWLGTNRALVCWRETPLPMDRCSDVWPGLSELVAVKAPVLQEMREALDRPVLAFDLNYAQGAAMPLPHLAPMKGIAQWLSAEVLVRLHEGPASNAWPDLKALAELVERHREEPVMISELVRVAIAAIAVNATWQALQAPGWQEELLADLQAHWQAVDLLAQAEPVLGMERAVSGQTMEQFRESFDQTMQMFSLMGGSTTARSGLKGLGQELLDDPKEAFEALKRRSGYWRWKWWGSYEDELVDMQAQQLTLEAVRAIRKGGAWAGPSQQLKERLVRLREEHPRAGRFLGFYPDSGESYHRFLFRLGQLEIQRTLLVTAIALKRYELQEKALPPSLEALVPRYLREVPRDVMDGQPLRYRLKPEGSFTLYSVGNDGVDNGGDASPLETKSLASFRWSEARDAVWPQPAGAEEVKAYFAELAAEREKFQKHHGAPIPETAPVSFNSVTNAAQDSQGAAK